MWTQIEVNELHQMCRGELLAIGEQVLSGHGKYIEQLYIFDHVEYDEVTVKAAILKNDQMQYSMISFKMKDLADVKLFRLTAPATSGSCYKG